MKQRCENVWLAVSGLVIVDGKWLVVKKKYGGLKGVWSLPAGFVNADETVDEAVIREVREETGIETEVQGLIGIRSGVIKSEVSDNMLIFLMNPTSFDVTAQQAELYEARFMDPSDILKEPGHSVLLGHLLTCKREQIQTVLDGVNPGDHFGYTAYKLFL